MKTNGICARAVISTLIILSGRAEAQLPAPGPRCEEMLRQYAPDTLWKGTIRGRRVDSFDWVEDRYHEACFTSRAACEKWLYDLRSYYTDHFIDGCGRLKN